MWASKTINRLSYRVNGGNWNANVANDRTVGSADISGIGGAIFAIGYISGSGKDNTFNFGRSYPYPKPAGANDC